MREFHNDALKIVIFVLAAVYWNDVVGEITDDLVADLYKVYQEVYNDIDNTDKQPASARRVFKQNELYSVHINKLREVNGYKRHNLLVKLENLTGNNPIVYINNPVESKIPNAYLTLEEFRTALISRAKKNMHTFDPLSKLRKAKKDMFNNARTIVTANVEEEEKQYNKNYYGVNTVQRKPLNVNKNQENNGNINKYSSFSVKRRPTKSLKMGGQEPKTTRISQRVANKFKEITKNVNLYRPAPINNRPTKPNSGIQKTRNILQSHNYDFINEKGKKYAKGASISLNRLSNNSTSKDENKNTISTSAFFALSANKSTESTGKVTSIETIDTTYLPSNTVPENAATTATTEFKLDNTTITISTDDLTTKIVPDDVTTEGLITSTDDNTENTEALTLDTASNIPNDDNTGAQTIDNTTITISTDDSTTEIVPDDVTTGGLITSTDDNSENTEALTLDTASNIPNDDNTGAQTIDTITTDILIADYTENTEFQTIDTTPTSTQTDDTKNTETVTDDTTTTVDYTDDGIDDSETVPDADSGNDSNTTPTATQTDDTKNTQTVTDDTTTTVDYTDDGIDDSETVPDADSGNDSNAVDPVPPEKTKDNSTEDSAAQETTDNDVTMEKTNENTSPSSNTLLRTLKVTRTSSTWRTYARPRVFIG